MTIMILHTITDEKMNEWIETLSHYEDVYTDNGYLAYRNLEEILNELRAIKNRKLKEE